MTRRLDGPDGTAFLNATSPFVLPPRDYDAKYQTVHDVLGKPPKRAAQVMEPGGSIVNMALIYSSNY